MCFYRTVYSWEHMWADSVTPFAGYVGTLAATEDLIRECSTSTITNYKSGNQCGAFGIAIQQQCESILYIC